MSVSYTCPNAKCGVTLKTPTAVPAGKKVKCPKCKESFTPVPEEAPAAAGAGDVQIRRRRAEETRGTAPARRIRPEEVPVSARSRG